MSLPLVGLYSRSPLSQITPFTYRDGETFLEQMHRLRCWIDYVNDTLTANIAQVVNDDQAADTALANELNTILTAFTTQWNNELESLEDQAVDMARDPTTGSLATLNVVINHVYDNTRYYAYFADQLDNFQYTAAQWDAMQNTARHFDLILGYSPITTQAINTVPSTVIPS